MANPEVVDVVAEVNDRRPERRPETKRFREDGTRNMVRRLRIELSMNGSMAEQVSDQRR